MNRYMLVEKHFFYNGTLKFGKNLKININDRKIEIYNKSLQKIFITNKVYKKYLKTLKLINVYLESDDDTGSFGHLALDEVEKFRVIIKNKYRDYLMKNVMRDILLSLSYKEMEIKEKFMFSNSNNYIDNKHRK